MSIGWINMLRCNILCQHAIVFINKQMLTKKLHAWLYCKFIVINHNIIMLHLAYKMSDTSWS